MKKVSTYCEKNITNIEELIGKAVKEIKIANSRAESAEKMLLKLRETFEKELQNAYNEGYRKALQDNSSNDGGTAKSKDDTKLVLKTS